MERFFQRFEDLQQRKTPTVFFDSVGDQQDAGQGYFLSGAEKVTGNRRYSVFYSDRQAVGQYPNSTQKHSDRGSDNAGAADVFSIKDEDTAKIISLTAGLQELLRAYDTDKSFEENVHGILYTDSVLYFLALDWMGDCFRTPETYNMLYGMTHGYNRISELSKLSGYPKNKCDKNIKALIEHGLVRKDEGKNGHSKYYPANSYLTLC